MSGTVLFVGNALLDISTTCDSSTLQKYHLKPDENCEASEVHETLFNYLLTCSTALYTPGGSAQNSSRVAQWIFYSIGKGKAVFIGCIGNDDFGSKLKNFLKEAGVTALYDVHSTLSTGITAALVTNDNKRSLCAKLGASSVLNEKYLNSPLVKQIMSESDIIYVEGYVLSHSPSSVINLVNFSQHSKKFSINLSAEYICETYFEPLKNCLTFTDIIIGNQNEANALALRMGCRFSSVEECALALLSSSTKTCVIVITQGPDPVVVAKGCGQHAVVDHFEVPVISDIGDTIGCGDAFAGGFVAALSLGMLLADAIRCAIYCATEVAKNRGCIVPDHKANITNL